MSTMRIVFAAAVAVTAGLIASGALGVAGAETTPTTTTSTTTAPAVAPVAPLRTVSVQGVAIEAITPSASAASATAVYRQGMGDALGDALAKAQFLAGKAGATLGPVQSMAENGGSIGCAGEAEYTGEQPDFGYTTGNTVRVAPSALAPHKALGKVRKRRTAKKAASEGCTLSTQVSVVYSLS